MAGLNKVMIIGNVGSLDAKMSKSGVAIANLSIATSKSYVKDGQTINETEWHNVVAFQRLAEIIDQYVKKGHKLYVEGSLKTEKYTDKQGIEKYSTKIIASSIQLLERKEGSDTKQYQSTADTKSYHQDGAPFDDSIPF